MESSSDKGEGRGRERRGKNEPFLLLLQYFVSLSPLCSLHPKAVTSSTRLLISPSHFCYERADGKRWIDVLCFFFPTPTPTPTNHLFLPFVLPPLTSDTRNKLNELVRRWEAEVIFHLSTPRDMGVRVRVPALRLPLSAPNERLVSRGGAKGGDASPCVNAVAMTLSEK